MKPSSEKSTNGGPLDNSFLAAHIGRTMTNANSTCAKIAPYVQGIMRIVIALLFMQHGGQKLLGYPPGGHKLAVNALVSLVGLAGFLELAGGALVLLGFLTRPVAFILSGEMAVAYFMAHGRTALWPAQNGGELAVVYCFVFLFFAAAGAGALSIDTLRHKG
jgi:putative oxidoreductase